MRFIPKHIWDEIPKMKLIDWYILKKFLTTFIFVVVMLVAIIVVIDYTEKNEKLVRHNVPTEQIIDYYLTFIPWIANLIAPITVFITAVLVTAGMAAKTEIVAIFAGGVSFRRMMLPYFIGSVVIALVTFYANGWLIPDSNKYRIEFEVAYMKKPFYFNARNIHFKVAENDYLYMQRYNNRSEVGYKVTLEKIVDKQLKEKLTAKKMTWNDSIGKWQLDNWELRKINDFGETYEKGVAMDTLINLFPTDFDTKYLLNESMNLTELNEYIDLQKSRGADDVQIFVNEKYIRYMLPFTAIILTFMGVSVSAEKSTRGGAGFKIALGFLIAFVFIIMFVLVKAIAEAGSMNPLFAIWIPNIVGTIATVILYRLVPK